MKKRMLISALEGVFVKKAYAWSGDVHKDIIVTALELMESEKKARPAAFYKNYRDQLLEGCVAPDREGDIDKGPGLHYYSCLNPKGKELSDYKGYYRNRLGDISPSLRTLCRANYTAAVSLYKSGRQAQAMVCLGRAIHFLSDMGCNPHVCNIKLQDKAENLHYAFERHINTTYTRHRAKSFDKRLPKYYEKADPGEAFNKLTQYAAKFLDTISHLDPRAFDDAAGNTLPMTQQNVMALLLRFYDDCQGDKGNFVIDSRLYTFKNEATGLIITIGEKAPTLEKPDKEKEQKLKVTLTDQGTFGIRAADSSCVNSTFKGYDYLKMDGKPAQFRLEALGNKRFIIRTEESGYVKVICNSKGGKIGTAEYEPEDSLQIWVLN